MVNPIIQTNAYKIVETDKKLGSLSHAYMIVSPDEAMLESYLLEIAKLIACGDEEGVAATRTRNLIDKKLHSDVSFYPKDKKLSVANADEIISDAYIRPLELPIRIFIMNKFEDLAQYQNKLLKTLEEPPKNVILLLGVVNENAVLATVKSRSKILTVPLFSEDEMIKALSADYVDGKKLSLSAKLSGGRLGEAIRFYNYDKTESLYNFCVDVLTKMNAPTDVLSFADRAREYAVNDVIAALKSVCGSVLTGEESTLKGKIRFRPSVTIGIIDRLNKLEKTVNFNGNTNMVTDSVLFSVMEEKARWQRLSV